jgi:hypothetical protein
MSWTIPRRHQYGFLPSEWPKGSTTVKRELFYYPKNYLEGGAMTSLMTWIFFTWAIGIIVVQFIS